MLNEEGIKRAEKIAHAFNHLLHELKGIIIETVGNREFSITKTKLEEASFFAEKAMANQAPNQKGFPFKY